MWLIKKLTATYLTLGLSDIGKQVGIDSAEEVREIIISMVRFISIFPLPMTPGYLSSLFYLNVALTYYVFADRLRRDQWEHLRGRHGDVLGPCSSVHQGRAGYDARRSAGEQPHASRYGAYAQREQGIFDEGTRGG